MSAHKLAAWVQSLWQAVSAFRGVKINQERQDTGFLLQLHETLTEPRHINSPALRRALSCLGCEPVFNLAAAPAPVLPGGEAEA